METNFFHVRTQRREATMMMMVINEEVEVMTGENYFNMLRKLYGVDLWQSGMKRRTTMPPKENILISYTGGVHQLHIFIFVLAVFHVLYSVILMGLGQAEIMKWKTWELETSLLEYQFSNDPARFRFTHQTSYEKRHAGFSTPSGIGWIVAFFRQFFGSIPACLDSLDLNRLKWFHFEANIRPTGRLIPFSIVNSVWTLICELKALCVDCWGYFTVGLIAGFVTLIVNTGPQHHHHKPPSDNYTVTLHSSSIPSAVT